MTSILVVVATIVITTVNQVLFYNYDLTYRRPDSKRSYRKNKRRRYTK